MFLLIGMGLIGYGFFWLWSSWSFAQGAETHDALIVGLEESKPRRIGKLLTTRPVFEYQGKDGPRTISTRVFSSSHSFKPGQRHPILVNPDYSDYCRVGGKWLYPYGVAFIAGGVFVISILPSILGALLRF